MTIGSFNFLYYLQVLLIDFVSFQLVKTPRPRTDFLVLWRILSLIFTLLFILNAYCKYCTIKGNEEYFELIRYPCCHGQYILPLM